MAETMGVTAASLPAGEIKTCCAALYASDWARLLLGESFHPGGVPLTLRLGALLGLGSGARVLDVAAGRGTSALALAGRYGCAVVGVDFASGNAREARAAAARAGLADRAHFAVADAERLPFADASFDALVCECAFCTFPDKRAAAREFARVLRPGGRVGLSDLSRAGALPPDLDDLLAWVACIAEARPVEDYVALLEGAGLRVGPVEPHDEALAGLVRDVRARLLGAEVLAKLGRLALPAAFNIERAKSLARSADAAVRDGRLGYALVVGVRPGQGGGAGARG
ncbi:MAG TPA: methyltransferase domain-containing protein [Thermomicrobiales bacterium]|nr:methyltransferase domain-containing protein [Thermomicrobiales bacterium]